MCVNTVSDIVVRHTLAYLSLQKICFSGDVSYYVIIWPKLTNPIKNAVYARRASAVTPSEKVRLTRIGSPLRAF